MYIYILVLFAPLCNVCMYMFGFGKALIFAWKPWVLLTFDAPLEYHFNITLECK